jgi:hypothetical protein
MFNKIGWTYIGAGLVKEYKSDRNLSCVKIFNKKYSDARLNPRGESTASDAYESCDATSLEIEWV